MILVTKRAGHGRWRAIWALEMAKSWRREKLLDQFKSIPNLNPYAHYHHRLGAGNLGSKTRRGA
ncbi:hypothetical protein, partial [Escherichia coli]|uniref:hypothetical protein n=1 Tax=Escherichia coli TaxID=562 RepID=UPI000BD565E3